ncbi:MAG: DUF2520 domain-containing protein [Bacteroidales bacterium]|nr:DUF2520 domain-containing protein [Bacteroidales bacterium]
MISFIGAGKVGVALGLYFKEKGFEIGGYYSRTYQHTQRAAKSTGSEAYSSIAELLRHSSMVWITASDDALPLLAEEISRLEIPQQIEAFIHTSGVHSTKVLQPINDAGFNTYSAHPLMAFAKAEESVEALSSAYFSIETSTKEKTDSDNCLTRLIEKTGNNILYIDTNKKELYHCAATVLSNYMVTLLNMSYEMFAESGMSKSEIKEATAPLLKSTLNNINQNELMSDALTGPIKRGDSTTIAKHLKALHKFMPSKKRVYTELGKETMDMLQDYKLKDILT